MDNKFGSVFTAFFYMTNHTFLFFVLVMAVVVQGEITGHTSLLQRQPPPGGGHSHTISNLTPLSTLLNPAASANYDMYYMQGQPGQVARRRKRDPFTFSVVVMLAGAAAYTGYKRYKAGRNPFTNKSRNTQNELSNIEKGQTKANLKSQREQLYQSYQSGVQHGRTLATPQKSTHHTTRHISTYQVVPAPAFQPEPTVALEELTEDQKYKLWLASIQSPQQQEQAQTQSIELDSRSRERSVEQEYKKYVEKHERDQDKKEAIHHIEQDDEEQQHRLAQEQHRLAQEHHRLVQLQEQQQDDQTIEYSSAEQRRYMRKYEAEQAAAAAALRSANAPPKKGFLQKQFSSLVGKMQPLRFSLREKGMT